MVVTGELGLAPRMVVMEPDGRDWRVGLGAWITSSGDHTDGLGAWITSSGDHTDGCDGRVGPNV
jgi:hypothetical protein